MYDCTLKFGLIEQEPSKRKKIDIQSSSLKKGPDIR